MSLNLYDILQTILSETVTPKEVNDAIDNKIQVIINYNDEENHAPNKRLIEPYAYGLTKNGNAVIRAYQYEGDTYRGKPKWKLFRLDRISNWQPTEQHFNMQPNEHGWNAEDYNEHGDNSMINVLNQVHFDYDETSNNPYKKGSKPYQIRKQTDNYKQSKPITIKQLQNNKPGPIINDTDTQQMQQQKNDDFQKMLQRNLDITRQEKEKRGFSLSQPNNPRGPITQNDNNELTNNIEKNKNNGTS